MDMQKLSVGQIITKELKERLFLSFGAGSGAGDGAGHGYSAGDGIGYGFGSGAGTGAGADDGDGYGADDGDGIGYGAGAGSGSGDGYGDVYGSGFGSGSGYSINGNKVLLIDGIRTILTKIKTNVAQGFIVNEDETLSSTFVVKDSQYDIFAHGKTLQQAYEDLQKKVFSLYKTEERIELFVKEVDPKKKYPLRYFFDWHGKLTGSCLQGRESFIKNNNLKLTDEIDLQEFIKMSKGQYGSEVIEELAIKEVVMSYIDKNKK